MKDGYGRNLNYLRLSVTDRCNLRCRYCMPEDGVESIPHGEVLRYDEILRLVRIMAGLGVQRLRLTGGEPLVRRGLADLAAEIKRVPGIRFLGLTTNAIMLPEMAEDLLRAGVDGVNISLDTLAAARYAEMTRRNQLAAALAGLETALALPFPQVKVNCVLAPESLPEDWLGVVGLAQQHTIDVRLIEWMPMAGEAAGGAVQADDALAMIAEAYGAMQPAAAEAGGGPARMWHVAGFAGRVGIIPAMSHSFCSSCNRLRLTAAGDLKLCLFYDVGLPLKPLLRSGAADRDISAAILDAVQNKPKQHLGHVQCTEDGVDAQMIAHAAGMYKTGG